MFDVMVEGVLEARVFHGTVGAYPLGDFHSDTVGGEERRKGKVPAFAAAIEVLPTSEPP
jgi:hypothetical protein